MATRVPRAGTCVERRGAELVGGCRRFFLLAPSDVDGWYSGLVLRRLRKTFSRALVLALVLMVAVGAALPAWARTIAGPQAHVCHCEKVSAHTHSHCACPICFPELRDANDDFQAGLPTISSRCGNDDPGWQTLACAGAPIRGFVVSPPLARLDPPPLVLMSNTQWLVPPNVPPPRSDRSSTTL